MLPQQFIDRIRSQYADADALIAAIDTKPYISIRLNPLKPFELGWPTTNVPWHPDGLYLSERPSFVTAPAFHAGAYYPQEASSMFLRHVLEQLNLPEEPLVLDLCAAPGGKTTLTAAFLNGRGIVVANETVRQRAWILRENVVKQGFSNCMVCNCPTRTFAESGAAFDLILVDAPCSGEGMFRKDEVARQEWSVENANNCAIRQREILADAWQSLAEGGILIYSTCTFNPAENELNVAWLLDEYDAETIDIPIDPSWGLTALSHGYAFLPHKVRGEGLFISVIRKKDSFSGRVKAKLKSKKYALRAGLITNNFEAYNVDNSIIALPSRSATTMLSLAEIFKPLLNGICVGELMRNELIPAPELPLYCNFVGNNYGAIDLTLEEALEYLRGGWNASIPAEKGYFIVRYKQLNLGFIKALGNRVNNLFPKEWRIKNK